MDPQLQAVRQAARERFLAHQGPRDAPTAAAASFPEMLASLPPDRLDAPISSLLADAPAEPPAAKRPRVDPDAVVIPKERTAEISRLLAQPPPQEIRFLCWNIDGLDEVGGGQALAKRVLSVAKEIATKRPAAVLLQEVIPPALELLSAAQVLGGTYDVVAPEDPQLPYYVAILLDRKRLRSLSRPVTVPFPSSQMGRQLLAVTVELVSRAGTPPLVLATAHLESTKDHAPERKRQLAQSLRYLQGAVGRVPAGCPAGTAPVGAALLGGDLNIRDEEVKAVQRELGDAGFGIADVWAYCGSPEAERWTWDTSVNTNIGASFVCKTRFDRQLFVSRGISDVPGAPGAIAVAKAKAKAKAKTKMTAFLAANKENDVSATEAVVGWRPTSISLVGKTKVPDLGRFPSDHWGVLTAWSCGQPSLPGEPSGGPEPLRQSKAVLPVAPCEAGKVVIDLDE